MYSNVRFFPNLNALRFFAAMLVLFHHAEGIRAKNGFAALQDWSFFQNGGTAVKFFFVLSGFLITYLLLREKRERGTVHVGNFYMRRVVRIWPLYFLLVLIGAILFPVLFQVFHIDYVFPYSIGQTWWMFLFFLPSLVTFYYGSHLLEPLWSIGVEEWFYFLWAPFFKWIKRPLTFIVGILAVKLILLFLLYNGVAFNALVTHFIKTYAFESMSIGGLAAYLVFHAKGDVRALYSRFRPLNYSLLGILVFYIFCNNVLREMGLPDIFHHWLFDYIALNLLFANAIVYCALVLPASHWLNKGGLDLMGKISYGIYMYHMLVIFAVIHMFKKPLLTLTGTVGALLFYLLVIAGTIVVAYLSKRYFEDFFLHFRKKFA